MAEMESTAMMRLPSKGRWVILGRVVGLDSAIEWF
jgi:hypothetical protein